MDGPLEDVKIWKQVLRIARETYRLTGDGVFHQDWGLRDPFRRCALSIMTNIADSFDGNGDTEAVRCLSVARGACGELRLQLELAYASQSLGNEDYTRLRTRTVKLGTRLSSLICYLECAELVREDRSEHTPDAGT